MKKITIKPTASGSAQSFTRHEDGSVWSVPIANNTVASGGIGAAYDHPITITLKNGKTLNDLGLANTPLSFSSAWITGKDYGKVIPNKLVRESIDNSWFIASGNDKKTASDNGLTNAFTGTPGTGVNTQPTLKVLPRFTSDGKADSIELVYTMKVSAAMGVVNLSSNTFQSVPYIEQELPKSLLPYLDLNETYIYKSDADGSAVSGVQKLRLSWMHQGNLIHVIQMPLVLRQNLTHHKVMLIRFVIILTKISLEQLQGNLVHIQFLTRLRTQLIQSNWLRN